MKSPHDIIYTKYNICTDLNNYASLDVLAGNEENVSGEGVVAVSNEIKKQSKPAETKGDSDRL